MDSPIKKIEGLLLHVFTLLFLLSLLCLDYGSGYGGCSERERQALLAFKHDLGEWKTDYEDHHGFNFSSWGSEENKRECCNWYGINCNTAGHVDYLNLLAYGGSYDGKLSPALLDLPDLDCLYLDGIITEKDNYQIPGFFGSFKKLQYLSINSCGFKSVSDELGNLSTSITWIDLSFNEIEGPIPQTLWNLISLEYLYLSYNQLTGPVPDLGRFTSLRELDLRSNKLNGTIHEAHLSKLHSLNWLDLSYNSLVININPDWTPPFQLEALYLAYCEIGLAFPKWILTQSNLFYLDVSSAGIVDVVPEGFWNFAPNQIYYFNISHNQLSGRVADLSSNLNEHISTIDISYNNFSGPLPLLHPNISSLRLSNNQFQGPISSICRILDLESLDLSHNQFSGDIPDCWVNRTSLAILNLSNNKLSGKIPNTLCSSSNSSMRILQLDNNNLSGELPSNLKNCTVLELMDVGENMIEGSIPSWIGTHLTHLTVLRLRNNKFHGGIPTNICHLSDIQVLDLSRNSISGTIPDCFNNFTSMFLKNITFQSTIGIHRVFLESGYIENAIVQWKGKESEYRETLGFLKLIDLSSNTLTGSIPDEFSPLKAIGSLNLSGNQLTGKINSDIGEMEMLECLDLSNNHISGEIPAGLANLSKLAVLNLSNNNLSGKIPTGTQLDTFDASAYAGNSELCGRPLKLCPDNDPRNINSVDNDGNYEDDGIVSQGFYICMAVGFVVGLWGVVLTLFLNKSQRNVCFIF